MPNEKGLTPAALLIVILVVVALGGLLYLSKNKSPQPSNDTVILPLVTSEASTSSVPTTFTPPNTQGWKAFVSSEYIITHHSDNQSESPKVSNVQFSIQYPDSWKLSDPPVKNYPLVLEKNSSKISVLNTDNQTGQLCDIFPEAKTAKNITSPYAKLLRVKSPFDTKTDHAEFIICAQELGPTNGYTDITLLGEILFDLPTNYNQTDLDEMDAIISTLTKVKLTGYP